jgi:monooxygenase
LAAPGTCSATFGYRFKPWKNPQPLSDGASIRAYLRETVEENGIGGKIRFGHKVTGADWCGKHACWTVNVQTAEGPLQLKTRFLCMCSGYYSYEEAHRPLFAGEEQYRGEIALPQFWPQALDYTGKQVVIVGSGATAVTLLPAMADMAGHVTMLQRSPTYIMSLPATDSFYQRVRKWLPQKLAYRFARWKSLFLSMTFYKLSRIFPRYIRGAIRRGAVRQLPPGYDVDTHFNPRYNPWDQRLCFVPDGDFYKALRKGKASVMTDEIFCFTETGLLLKSGRELKADVVVLATGLNLRLLGGAKLTVDGKPVVANDIMVYKGMLVSDVPNLALAFGYTNASWTLKTDLTANYVCRLLNYMDRKGHAVVVPRRQAGVSAEPFLNFDAGYIKRAGHILPKQGSRKPWRVYQNYLMDMLATRFGRIADGALEFK